MENYNGEISSELKIQKMHPTSVKNVKNLCDNAAKSKEIRAAHCLGKQSLIFPPPPMHGF